LLYTLTELLAVFCNDNAGKIPKVP